MSDYQYKDKLRKFSYALGLTISSNLMQSGIDKLDASQFMSGLRDTFSGNIPKISEEEANLIVQEFMLTQNEEEALRNFEESLLYLSNNSKNEGVVETESGLQYKVLVEGSGRIPNKTDQVRCHYHGILLDGRVFESSVERKQPVIFPVTAVIDGWEEALLKMKEGSKWRLFIPPNLGYGEEGVGGLIGPNATLIIDVEFLEIV
jgi:FKBP-type peptidyl-prolyl cis-trans isomerase FklB